ncbi:MAG: peroxiredoxin [Myxococcales bacterium]|nr:peroxiredoxin [Myxococcales bacterium]MCB9751991.1 peroxiredoxin [Myxococcales bacterium]
MALSTRATWSLSLLLLSSAAAPLGSAACGPVQRPDGGSGLLAVGSPAPLLSATAHDGATVDLSALEGAPTVIYFYPKDNTPGCTKEACAFRDAWTKLEDAGVQVIGVSADSLESHRAFAKEHALPFPLVSDPELRWAKAFGVPDMAGVLSRVSFLIGRDGTVAKVYPDVDPALHADEVLRDAAAS